MIMMMQPRKVYTGDVYGSIEEGHLSDARGKLDGGGGNPMDSLRIMQNQPEVCENGIFVLNL